MSERFVRLHHWDPKCPGLRLRLEWEPGENAQLVEETTLPERVMSPDANRKERHEHIWLTTQNVRWLHEATGELLSAMADVEQCSRCGRPESSTCCSVPPERRTP